MTLDWATGILLAALAQNLIVAVAVLSMRSGRSSDWRLAALLCVLAGKTTPYIFGWRGHVEAPDWLALFPLNAPLAVGPLLYAYVFARTMGKGPRREWLHFIPALLELGYCCGCLLLPATIRHEWKETGHDHRVKPALELAFVISLFCYTISSLRLMRRLRLRLVQERSDADRHAMALLSATFALLFVTAVAYAGIFFYSNWIAELDIGPFFLWLALVSMGLALEGWRATAMPLLPAPIAPPALPERKAHDWPALGRRWRDRTDDARWWCEPDLSLADLSRRLGVNSTYLSRAINEGLGVNFNELINGMRADEVARRIDAGDGSDLLELAFAAGFSSKATFNRAFHARFGVSPSAYRRRLKC
ncbi:helix-turn-helix domain-containing protein [uncultured Sphingomonas sp.]|uniref:AraC family transcriptional regulator n=1 Tax=uncultured Sphingomonas sp. TaxID=158754 RepID=UPI0035C94DEE